MRGIGQLRGAAETGGLAGWLLMRMGRVARSAPRLSLVERISLGPRQSLALVEAEGQRLLVATSGEGGPVFYPLNGARPQRGGGRVSW